MHGWIDEVYFSKMFLNKLIAFRCITSSFLSYSLRVGRSWPFYVAFQHLHYHSASIYIFQCFTPYNLVFIISLSECFEVVFSLWVSQRGGGLLLSSCGKNRLTALHSLFQRVSSLCCCHDCFVLVSAWRFFTYYAFVVHCYDFHLLFRSWYF